MGILRHCRLCWGGDATRSTPAASMLSIASKFGSGSLNTILLQFSQLRALATALFAIALSLAFVTPSTAQVPRTLNYQGYLTTPGGTPINGSASVTVSIWNALAGGTELMSSTFPTLAVSNGIFNVTLDATVVPFSVPTFVQVIVNGETLSPRQPINASAYAIRASADPIALECSRQLGTFTSVPGNTYGFGVSANCPTGYTATGLGIEAPANVVMADSAISTSGGTVFTYNLGSTAQNTRAWVQCCRVPGR